MSTTNFTFDTAADKNQSKRVVKIVIIVVVALLILGGLGLFGLVKIRENNRLFSIPSEAMAPTLVPNDRVRTSKVDSDTEIKRGWVVVFDAPDNARSAPGIKSLIKRVIALPGDTIESRNGLVLVNGATVDESYLAPGTSTTDIPEMKVPAGQYYVLGDNRENSADSRTFGPIDRDLITNHATRVIAPLDHRQGLDGPVSEKR